MSGLGRFVRFDLMSADPDGSRAFYAELLGWRFTEEQAGPFTATVAWSGDERLGWLVPLGDAPVPTHWIGYVGVADVDATCAAIGAAGGTVCVPPTDLPHGRFAVAEDPNGGLFSPFASATLPTPAFAPADGTLCWAQLLTRDARVGAAFYQAVFGWTVTRMPMGDRVATLFGVGDFQHCSMLARPADASEARDYWLPYFLVDDLAAGLERAVALGARVTVAETPVPSMGSYAVLTDPQGAQIALWQNP